MSVVSMQEFLNQLTLEAREMKRRGTPYRQDTAALSLKVAKTQSDVLPFRNRENAFRVAASVLNEVDNFRLLDVAQMLNAVLCSLERRKNASDELMALVAERSKNYKLVSLR